jgi:hypothetical protein
MVRPEVRERRPAKAPREALEAPCRALPQGELRRRAEPERRRLTTVLETERKRLARRHAGDLRQRATEREREVTRRQAQERQQFDEFAERQRRDLAQRLEKSRAADKRGRGGRRVRIQRAPRE